MSAPSTSKPTEPPDKTSIAWKIFMAFVNNSDAALTESELLSYAENDLKLPLNVLSNECKEYLPNILVAYMNMWSGWQYRGDCQSGKLSIDQHFIKFHKFMNYKIKLIANQKWLGKNIFQSDPASNNANVDKNSPDLDYSPFAIAVNCPPSMLNTIIFTNNGDDVIMKQHLGSKWKTLSTVQLLNWPYVQVIFRSYDLHFTRTQCMETTRYLNLSTHECKKVDETVVDRLESGLPDTVACYTYKFLHAYVTEYIDALKAIKKVGYVCFFFLTGPWPSRIVFQSRQTHAQSYN